AALGNELSLALDNAFYFAQARSRAANLETIFRISQAVGSSLQIKVVLNRVLDVVQKIFSADAVSLMEYDENRQMIVTAMARGLISNDILHYECEPGEVVPGRVYSGGEPIKIDDLSLDSGGLPASSLEQGLTSLLSVPLLARGRSLGVLTIFSVQSGAFSDEDMGLLHTFASQAALAIDTADLYGKEHHVASVLQASILPQNLPDFAEIEAASVYLPAGQDAEIGGDYFDLFKAPDGSIVMAIGDVCGKGIEAATKTSMIKFSVRALVAAGLGPAAVLAEVNRMIAETGRTSDIVTLWVGLLDARTGRLRYAHGGHPPAIVRTVVPHADGRLATTGPLLGALMDAEYDEAVTELRADEIVLLYTDGVTEARRGNKFFGEGRVRRSLTKANTAAEAVDGLLSALDVFVPGNLRDDAAVLAIRLREQETTDGA
ncbi:MAG: SpoIIE family protein phosphatase, partial [Actinomycetota bacterium]|nr:SpoIIE family protein phosphatase [Actinomycetota bacterium]